MVTAIRRALVFVALVPLLTVAACTSDRSTPQTPSASPTLTVAAALYPLEEVVSRVGGTTVNVLALTPPGEDPHDRDLTAKQLDALADADIVFYLGEGFQPTVEKAVSSLRGVTKVDLLDSVTLLDAVDDHAEDDHDHGAHDPHVWLDPANMTAMARAVAQTITIADQRIAPSIETNLAAYVAELDDLGADIDSSLATCRSRALVTAHDAFGYLAHRAGLDTFAINGLNPNEEPSAKDLEALKDVIRGRNVTVVFYETLLPGDIARTIARSVGVTTDLLDPVENISSADRREGASYISVQRDNLARLVKGLGCS